MTLQEYISFWQETYDKHQSRPTTYAAHNYVFKNHILPGLGDIPLSELTSEMVGEFLEERKRFGNHRRSGFGLGEETMRHIQADKQSSLETDIFPVLSWLKMLQVYMADPPLLDMGTPEGIQEMGAFLSAHGR